MDQMEYPSYRAALVFEDDFAPMRTPKTTTNTTIQDVVVPNFQQLQLQARQTTKLSPLAKEFVPQGYGAASSSSSSSSSSGNLTQQRQTNGYHQTNHYEQLQMQQQQQQQQQQPYSQLVYQQQQQQNMSGGKSVQDRLNPTYYQQQHQNQHYQQQPRHQQRQHQHQQQQQQHQQQHQQRHNNNNYQQHHNQQYRLQQQQQQQAQQHGHSNGAKSTNKEQQSSSVETIALDYLKTVMSCLNQNPGQFDTVAPRFLNIYEGMENSEYVLPIAMEDIFEESIQNPNFRYMGAKLYNLLHMLNPKPDSLFHMLLKCKLDFHQQQVIEYLRNGQPQKVRETALFLAELYMQLRCDADDTQRIQLLAENIIYSLKQLLNGTLSEQVSAKEAADNVRCICLTLKLAGYDLTIDCGHDMAQIIAQLESINEQAPGKYPLAVNVINLQKNNWGRKMSTTSSSEYESNGASGEPSKPNEILRVSDDPIFYGPDGRELTAEESEFLSSGVPPDSTTDEEDLGGADLDVEYDLEMDEETELAYKEFCKLAK